MATTKASAKNIDFSKVKDGGQFNKARIPAGDYLAKIIKVEDAKAKDDTFQYLFTIQIVKRPSSKHPYYCKLVENQLWKLRNLFIAAGKSVPKSKIKVDPNQLVGKLIGVTIEDDEYEGKEQSTIVGVFPAAELDDDSTNVDIDDSDDEDEDDDNGDDLDVSDDDEDEDDDEVEEGDSFDDMSRNELKAYITERDSSFQARKSQSDDDLRSIARGLDNAGDDDEDEEDEPEPPKKAAKPAIKAAPAKKAAKKKVDEVTDEDLEELDIDDL